MVLCKTNDMIMKTRANNENSTFPKVYLINVEQKSH